MTYCEVSVFVELWGKDIEGQNGQEVSSSFIFCQHSAKTLKKSLLSELTKVDFSSFPLPGLLCLCRIFSVSRLQLGDRTQNMRVCFMRFNTKEKSCEKMTVANLLLAEVLAGNKFVQEVTEAHFLPLEQSCSTGRGLVPYIRGQQLYLLSRRLVSLYHRTSLKWSNFSNYMETFWTFQAKINNFNIVVFYAVMTNYSLLASLAFIFILDVIHELALRSQVK